MALSTVAKRIIKFGGDSKVIKTTTSLGNRAKDTLSALTGRTKVISKMSPVANTATDAAKSRKMLGATSNKESLGIRGAATKAIKGTGYGAMVLIPLAAGGYGVAKVGQAIGEVRQGFKGTSAEDLDKSRLDIIEKIIDSGGNPADYGLTEQNIPKGKDGSDSPVYVFANEQPTPAASERSVAGDITQVALVGGAVALGLMVASHFLKKKK